MLKLLDAFERFLVGLFIFTSSMLTFLLVILRYFFAKGITWGSEAVILMIVWSAFIGASIAIREKSHIELEVVRDLFPPRLRLPIVVLADLFCCALMLFIFIYGSKMTLFLHHSEGINVATELPEWLIFLCVPLGGLIMEIRYLQHLNAHVREMIALYRNHGSDTASAGGTR